MMNLDVRLISNDPLRIGALDRGGYITMLNPGEERVVPLQIEANSGAWVYLCVEYWFDKELLYWESPNVWIKVRRDPARILTLFSLEGPQYSVGEGASVEATIVSNLPTDAMHYDFWVETPYGNFVSFGTIELESMEAGDNKTRTTKFTPELEGN